MSSCLGLFVDNNLIKYAKISKENSKVKIENYGVKFYDNLEDSVKQIVDETFSYKVPISTNIEHEKYTNIEIFGLLSDSDQKKSLRTEFEYFCNETGKNRLTLEYRTIVSEILNDRDKKNALYSFVEKGNIAEKIQLLDPYRIGSISPVALTIPNLANKEADNILFINIENRTELTTVVNGNPVRVNIIDTGMDDILKKIAEKENSVNKAYEVCKNTTLYTAGSQNLQSDNNEYLEQIVPYMYKIVEETKKIIDENDINIDKIYLTGSGTVINNIDLYFQENFLNSKCEILAPHFVDKNSLKLNIRDYIEVNSAISLAMQYLEKSNKNINFSTNSETWDRIKEVLTADVKGIGGKTREGREISLPKIGNIAFARFAYSVSIMLVIYIVITSFINSRINNKITLAEQVTNDTKVKTSKLSSSTALVNSRADNYESILEQLQEANDRVSNAYLSKNAIPNLLNEIMFAVPKEVQIMSINNTEDKHVTIQAQSTGYQYLGYLKSEIQNQAILLNVTSTSGTRVNDMIQVTIEGDLP